MKCTYLNSNEAVRIEMLTLENTEMYSFVTMFVCKCDPLSDSVMYKGHCVEKAPF
jgi:hypothetical protein